MGKEWIRVGVAFLILVGVTLFVSNHKKKKFEKLEQEDAKAKIVQLESKSIHRVDVVTKDETVVLLRREKKDDTFLDRWAPLSEEFLNVSNWWIKSPKEALADRTGIETLLSHLDHLESKKVIDEKGERLKEYDLDQPPVILRLYTQTKGKPDETLLVGAKNASGTGLYLKTSTSPRIVLAGMELNYLKERTLYDWRMKEIFGFKNKYDVQSLKLTTGPRVAGASFFATQKDRHWFLEKPKRLPGDDAVLDQLVAVVKDLRVKEFVSENAKADLKKYGFDHPMIQMDIDLKRDQEAAVRTFLFTESKNHPDLLVQRVGFPQIYAIEKSEKDKLLKVFSDLVSKRPYKISASDVTKISVTTAQENMEFEKEEGVWKLVKPTLDLANNEEVKRLLQKVVAFKATAYEPKAPPKSKKLYLDVLLTTDKETHRAVFTESAKKTDLWLYAENPQRAYRIAKSAVASVSSILKAAREHRMVPMDLEHISSFQMKDGDVELSLMPTPEDEWRIGKVEQVKAEQKKKLSDSKEVEALVNALLELKMNSFASYSELEKRKIIWTLEVRSKKGEAVDWKIGEKSGGAYPVWSPTRKAAGWVPSNMIENVQKYWR